MADCRLKPECPKSGIDHSYTALAIPLVKTNLTGIALINEAAMIAGKQSIPVGFQPATKLTAEPFFQNGNIGLVKRKGLKPRSNARCDAECLHVAQSGCTVARPGSRRLYSSSLRCRLPPLASSPYLY